MTGNASDAQIDRLVKAGWLKMGLSPNDLAEMFDAVLQPRTRQDRDEGQVDADRLTAIGHALEMPIDTVRHKGRGTSQPDAGQPEAGQPEAGQPEAGQPGAGSAPVDLSLSMLSLLELRLLRAFCQLQDPRTRRLLIHLAEQLVKRQTDRGGAA
jgi:hypothetical protein